MEGRLAPHLPYVSIDYDGDKHVVTHRITHEEKYLPRGSWEMVFSDEGFGALVGTLENGSSSVVDMSDDFFTNSLVLADDGQLGIVSSGSDHKVI